MYRALILDDEPAHAQRLARMIGSSRFGVRFELACAQDVSMLCADTVERPDALFADIRLDGASDVAGGIELVRSRFPRGCGTQVVYVTGYAEYCTPVYETEHVYFLTKPVRQAELDNALRAVLANLDERRMAAIPVQTGGRLIGLVPGRVRYLESDRRKVLVHGEGPCIETYATLSGLKAPVPILVHPVPQELPREYGCHRGDWRAHGETAHGRVGAPQPPSACGCERGVHRIFARAACVKGGAHHADGAPSFQRRA